MSISVDTPITLQTSPPVRVGIFPISDLDLPLKALSAFASSIVTSSPWTMQLRNAVGHFCLRTTRRKHGSHPTTTGPDIYRKTPI